MTFARLLGSWRFLLVAFLEGRNPADALPNSFFYTWILPAWGIWWWLILVALFLLVMVVTL